MRRLIVFWAISAMVMASGVVATALLCRRLISREQAELQSTVQADATRIGSQLQSGLLAAITPLERLGRWWLSQGKPTDLEDWATDGQLFLAQSPGLREAFWISRDGRQLWSAAPGKPPNLATARPDDRIQRQISTAPKGWPWLVSEVFDAPGSGPAFYVCRAVHRGNQVQGYVAGLFDVRALISAIATRGLVQERRLTILAGGRRIFSAGPAVEGPEHDAETTVQLANQVWAVELHAPLRYFHEFRGLILAVIGVVGALVYSFVALLALSQRWSSKLQRANSTLTKEVERRVRTEAAFRDLNRELSCKIADFEALLEVIPIGIAVAGDPECRNIRTNRALARMLGVAEGANISSSGMEAAALPYRVTRNGRDLPPHELPIRVASATGKTIAGEEDRIVRADGTVLDVLEFASPVVDEDGRVRAVMNACVDISDRKRLEQRLQKAERLKGLGAMAAGVAHDFNNLLTSILGHASLAAECVPKESEALQHIRASAESAQQASALTQKMLAFTGRFYHALRPTNLGELIEALRLKMAAPETEVRLEIAPQLPEVMANADEVRQALMNLVVNAAESTASGGGVIQVCVDCYELSGTEPQLTVLQEKCPAGRYVRVRVTDSGAGMPPEIAERAFDPFFSTKFLGRGLGLSEVLGILRAHNGAVRLATAPGAGTSVELFFPVWEALPSNPA